VFAFELDVPVVAPEPTVVSQDRTVTGYVGPRKTILVVDDVAANRAVAVDMLGQLGFDMVEATNGLEALEKAKARRPALVLMDVVMAEMDGLEATLHLREKPYYSDLPIFAISAVEFFINESKILAAGSNFF